MTSCWLKDQFTSMHLHDTTASRAPSPRQRLVVCAANSAASTHASLRSRCDLKPEPWSSCSARSRIDCQLKGDRDSRSVPRSMALHHESAACVERL